MDSVLPLCRAAQGLTDKNDSIQIHTLVDFNTTGAHHQSMYSVLTTTTPGPTTGAAAAGSGHLGWFETVLLCLCVVGVSGNLLNLLVLTRRRFCSSLNKLESSANYGLIALAVSDLCYCLVVLPYAFLSLQEAAAPGGVPTMLYYRVYGVATINLFLMTSTWVIIIIAVNRCIVVVYPLKAKRIVSIKSTVFAILLVYAVSLILTLPYYLINSVRECVTQEGATKYEYYKYYGADTTVTKAMKIYIRWIWPIISDFIPLLVLGTCNIRLVFEIKKSSSARQMYRLNNSTAKAKRSSNSRTTVTLVSIIVMYLFMVTPCELMKYINPFQRWGEMGHIIANATNALQTANFAFNFIIYCAVNSTFRQTLRDLVSRDQRGGGSHVTTSLIRKSTYSSEMRERQTLIVRRGSNNVTLLTPL